MSSCNYFHEPPITFKGEKLSVGTKLCFIGDTGTGDSHQFEVASVLEKENCSEVHLLGDIIYNGGLKSVNDLDFQNKFKAPYQNLLKTTPFFLSLGNHDYKGETTVWYEHAKVNKNIVFPSPFYHQIYGDLCITTLDTNAFFIKQLLWLNEIYSKSECAVSIFTGHHPLMSSGSHGVPPFIVRTFIENALQKNTKIYISGHEHQLSDEGVHLGTRFLISGAGGKLRPIIGDQNAWGESAAGYLVITIISNSPYIFKYEFIGSKNSKRSVLHFGRVGL